MSDFNWLSGIAWCNLKVKMPDVVAITNRKGGPSKTTSVVNLAGAFAALNLRVLVIDLDPQGSATNFFLGPNVGENLALDSTVGSLFADEFFLADSSNLILETELKNISIVANNEFSDPLNNPVRNAWEPHQTSLLEFIGDECKAFDIVLLDFPPSLYLLAWAGLIASDYVIIPVPPEMFATQGLRHVHKMIAEAREVRPDLRRLGHFVSRKKRSRTHSFILKSLQERFGKELFHSTLSEYHDYMEVSALGQPLEVCRPKTKAANEVRELRDEILERINKFESRRAPRDSFEANDGN